MPSKPAGNQKQIVQVGPFNGGLNNISLSGEARDSEVVDLVNLEVTVDTALTSRPPIEAMSGTTLPTTNTIGWEVLGIYRIDTIEWYMVVTVPKDGTTNTDTTVKAYLNGIVGTGETILTIKQSVGIANRVTSMVQFKDKLYFNVNTGATDTGFYWKKGDAVGGTAVAAMPRGNIMISWKTRLWVSGSGTNTNGDRVYFSTIDGTGPHPETWGAADFFDVAPGEGGFITAIMPSFNNIIVFKNDGTWRFSFPSKPAQGVVDKISGDVGCAGKNAVVDFENYMYVYDQGRVYELVNSNFTQINRFVNFTQDPSSVDAVAAGVELSVVNRRVLVRYFNSLYCFTVDSKAWSQWRSYNGTPGRFVSLPGDSNSSAPNTYIAASRGTIQSGSSNQIVDPTFSDPAINQGRAIVGGNGGSVTYNNGSCTLTAGTALTYMYLTPTGTSSADGYTIPVSTSQKITVTLNIAAISGTINVTFQCLLSDGTTAYPTSVPAIGVTTTGVANITFTMPAGAVLGRLYLRMSIGGFCTFSAPTVMRTAAVSSPFNLMRITDTYPDQVATMEYIECYFQTKSYDYKTPGNFKRLFWAGIDVKTSMDVKTEIRPVSRVAPITWGDMQNYTWGQLEQGMWGNPLSWLNVSFAVFNLLEADEIMSENGRYFKKLGKSLRFRQISYIVRLTSTGNKNTGPVKFFSLTTTIATKQDVVDTSA